jgi:rare lipoprotein A
LRRFRNARPRPGAFALVSAVAVIATSGIALGQDAVPGGTPSGSSGDPGATETRKSERVRSRMFVRVKRHVLRGKRMKAGGRVWPRRGRRRVAVKVNGKRVKVVRTRSDGRFRVRWRAPRPGRYRIKVVVRKTDRAWGKTRRLRKPVNVYRPAHASWYGPGFYGGTTACGRTLGAGTLGVAHRTLPCGSKVTLRYRGRTVRVPVIDRGPYAAGRDYDLTGATKSKLRFGSTGVVLATR